MLAIGIFLVICAGLLSERSSHFCLVLRALLGYTSAKNCNGSYLQGASLEEVAAFNRQTAA